METPPPMPVPPADDREQLPFATVIAPPASGSFPPAIPVASALPPSLPPDVYRYGPDAPRRPGLVTALGVIAIVVGIMSVLFNVAVAGETAVMFAFSRIAAAAGTFGTQASVAAPPPPQNAGPLSIGDASVVMAVLQQKLSLDGPHQRELSELLRKHGAAVIRLDDNQSLTAATVKDLVSEPHKAEVDSETPGRFSTPAGTVEIYSDHATFAARDGSVNIRTSAVGHQDDVGQSSSAAAPSTGPAVAASTALQPGEISRAIASIRQFSSVAVTPGQIATIRKTLADPNQALVISGSPTLVYYAQPLPTNELQIGFNSGTLTLDSTGRITATNTTAGAAMPPFPFKMPSGLTILVIIECALSALFAIYLFIVGILVLRGSFVAPKLLRIYAYPKMLLAIAGAVASAALIIASTGATGVGAQISASMAGIGLVMAGLAFPVGALIALHADSVKRFYAVGQAVQTELKE